MYFTQHKVEKKLTHEGWTCIEWNPTMISNFQMKLTKSLKVNLIITGIDVISNGKFNFSYLVKTTSDQVWEQPLLPDTEYQQSDSYLIHSRMDFLA